MAIRVNTKNKLLLACLIAALAGLLVVGKRLHEIEQFNQSVMANATPGNTPFKFEEKYAIAYQTARAGRYADASQLFSQLMDTAANPSQRSAVQYNLGNIYLLRGLTVHRNGDTVKDEAEYLINQARLAYMQSLRLDNTHIDARYNLDCVLRLLPSNPSSEDEQEKLGIVMGNIPTGLP